MKAGEFIDRTLMGERRLASFMAVRTGSFYRFPKMEPYVCKILACHSFPGPQYEPLDFRQ